MKLKPNHRIPNIKTHSASQPVPLQVIGEATRCSRRLKPRRAPDARLCSRRVGDSRWPVKRYLTILVLVCMLGWLATPMWGSTNRVWTGANSANWSDPNNWNPSGVPQNGDQLEFDEADFGDTPHRSMLNDLPSLSCSLDFNAVHGDFTLSGNTLNVSSFLAAPAAATDVGVTRTLTVNCPLVFANGGTIHVGTDTSPGFSGEDKSLLYLNGGLTVQNGTLTLQAVADSGRSGHAYIAGALSGAGDVKAETEEHSGTASSIEFDSQVDSTNYTGTLWLATVGNSQISFNQISGNMVSRHVGVHNGDTANLQLVQSDQNQTQLWIDPGCSLLLSGNNATFLSVFMVADSIELSAPYLATSSGVLLGINGGGISVHCNDNNHTPDIAGRLNFNGENQIYVYGTASTGLQIDANIEGVGFSKIGSSTLILDGTNTFTGIAEVDEGILDIRNSNALGSPGADTLLNGGSLTLRTSIAGERLTAESESTNGDAADFPGASLFALSANPISWDGPIVLDANLDVFGDDITFSGQISGAGGLGFFNLGTAQITGSSANEFSGTVLVRCPLLELNKSDAAIAIEDQLVVGGGSGGPYEVRWLQPNQISSETLDLFAAIQLYSNGRANLNNNNDYAGDIVFSNGGEVDTGSGVLFMIGSISVYPSSSATAVINGNLGWGTGGGDGVIYVEDGAAEPDLLVNAVVSGTSANVVKFGAGTLALAGANTYSAFTQVQQGTLEVENPSALGNAGSGCSIWNGATLALNNPGTIPNNLEVLGSGVGGNGAIQAISGTAALNGSVQLDGATVLNVASTASLGVNGVVSGSGPLTKTGPGPFTLGGGSPNTYSGDTTNESGLLYLAKSGGSAIAVPGNLVLGPAPANAAALAILLSPNSIGGSAVTVNANSSLGLNGRNQTLSQLTLNDGGSVTTGSGLLLLTSGANVIVGSLRTGVGGGSHVSASIQGNIGLPPNASPIQFNVSPYAFFFPFDTRPELDVPATIFVNGAETTFPYAGITKNGGGRMRLGGNDTFTGGTTVNSGTLQVDGTNSASGYVEVNGGTLKGTGSIGRLIMNGAAGAVAPGDNPGILTCYGLDAIGSGFSGRVNVELNGTTPGFQYDQLKTGGAVNLSGLSLTGSLGYTPASGDQFTIIANGSSFPVSGTFSGLPEGAGLALGDQVFHITYKGGDGNDVVLTDIGKLVIPELKIERAGTNLVQLIWPTNNLPFTLQTTTNVPATNWTAVFPFPAVIGTNNVVTNVADKVERFFRLKAP